MKKSRFQIIAILLIMIYSMGCKTSTNTGNGNFEQQLKDGWTILTADGKPSAHFEHNVALVNGKPELLSTFKYVYDALGIVSDEEKEFRKNK